MRVIIKYMPRTFYFLKTFQNDRNGVTVSQVKQIKLLPSILFTSYLSSFFLFLHGAWDGNFSFSVEDTFTWFANNLCTSNSCSVILSGKLDFEARIVEDLTLSTSKSRFSTRVRCYILQKFFQRKQILEYRMFHNFRRPRIFHCELSDFKKEIYQLYINPLLLCQKCDTEIIYICLKNREIN